ncbi:MAG: site-specific DNA-methyltransferase, partial [Thermoanaerobaculia bacterium]|nr:site-specific DNA-methyltransferase [Thermoanaerobaculia bacterium]
RLRAKLRLTHRAAHTHGRLVGHERNIPQRLTPWEPRESRGFLHSLSVLIVTIDEKEYLRLGLLLEQVFPQARIRMISSEISRKGSARADDFARVDEYLFIVMLGNAAVAPLFVEGLSVAPVGGRKRTAKVVWESMLRRGTGSMRADSPLKFYPVLLNPQTKKVFGCGDVLPSGKHPTDYTAPPGLAAVWPLRSNGAEGRWQLNRTSFTQRLEAGHIKAGRFNNDGTAAILYLPSGVRSAIAAGRIVPSGSDSNGGPEFEWLDANDVTGRPKTQWVASSHNASEHGTSLLKSLLPNSRFPFPKSLYAVEDALRFFIRDRPEAVVVDFFAGSGTTAHAVMRLNRQDHGRRQSILVTNNEVSADDQARLRHHGLRPGDPDWEAQGICSHITTPRIIAAITGRAPDGRELQGTYRFIDEFPMAEGFEENVEFFTMTYEAPRPVAHHRAFEAIAPLLWLRAGSKGRRIDKARRDFDLADTYGVLFDLDAAQGFAQRLGQTEGVRMAFIITDDDLGFQMVCGGLPAQIQVVRLYESYLTNFTINTGRE